MKRNRFYISLFLINTFSVAFGQITNKGALISGNGGVLLFSSMDIQNQGELSLAGTLELKGERKVISEKPVAIDQIKLSDITILEGNLMVQKHVDFGQHGLIKVKEKNALTFGPEATYSNYQNGRGVLGTVVKIEAKNFIFPLGTYFEAFPVGVNQAQSLVEASIQPEVSTNLGDFQEEGLNQPNLAVIKLNTSEEISASKLNLKFDEQKEEVVLNNGIWVEASKAPASNKFIATKAFSFNRATALETSDYRWLNVYPNPSTNEINISINSREAERGDINFRLIDMKGAVINQSKKPSKDFIGKYLLPDALINGTYFLEFEHENGKRSVVKQVIVR